MGDKKNATKRFGLGLEPTLLDQDGNGLTGHFVTPDFSASSKGL